MDAFNAYLQGRELLLQRQTLQSQSQAGEELGSWLKPDRLNLATTMLLTKAQAMRIICSPRVLRCHGQRILPKLFVGVEDACLVTAVPLGKRLVARGGVQAAAGRLRSETMMKQPKAVGTLASIVLAALTLSSPAPSQSLKTPYPEMAPVEQYRIANRQDEIALARSAAPPSISGDAQVLVLGGHGYEIASKGKNDFVCLVERSWAAGFDDPEFWNPRIRGPNCFNPPAARTELPQYLKRTEWVLAGATRQQIVEKTKAAIASHSFEPPDAGALSFMLSKEGYLSDDGAGPWLPHVMVFLPHGQAVNWGASKEGSPVIGQDSSAIETTVLFIPVRSWSDGSPAPPPPNKHQM